MKWHLLLTAVLAAIFGGALSLKATPAPTTTTTRKPTTTTPNYFYDEDDLVHGAAAQPITDHPVPAHHVPSGLKPAVYGYECTLQRLVFVPVFFSATENTKNGMSLLAPSNNNNNNWNSENI
jgi:hypothetical protein